MNPSEFKVKWSPDNLLNRWSDFDSKEIAKLPVSEETKNWLKEGFPEDLKITSVEENGQVMSLKHKEHNLYGVQFHPESILTEHGKEMINNFLEI